MGSGSSDHAPTSEAVSYGSSYDVSPTQRRVLETLRRRTEATVDELAELLGITPSAVRQHLTPLRSAGLVAARPLRGQTGRPADVYRCTPASDPLFPTEHALAVEILDDLRDHDPALIEEIFRRRRQRLVEATAADVDHAPVIDRVAAVTDQLDARGYLADFDETDDGTFHIHLHNCPIRTVADRYDHACSSELGFIADVLPDADVRRIAHKTEHCSTCTYEVAPVARRSSVDSPTAPG